MCMLILQAIHVTSYTNMYLGLFQITTVVDFVGQQLGAAYSEAKCFTSPIFH
jgi:uncharacterized protein (DUF2164 family)